MKSKIGFIGAGNMSSAMIVGLAKANLLDTQSILVYDLYPEKAKELSAEYHIQAITSLKELVKSSDILILAVKPNVVLKVLQDIKDTIRKHTILISIVSGFTISSMENILGTESKIVRTMPNIAALVQSAMISITPNRNVTEEELSNSIKIFSCFGHCQVVEEYLIHTVTGVSGSSPAYTFMYIEALADAAVLEGMGRAQAYEFAAQAVLGAAKMVLETKVHPATLKDMVCSPGGTSIQAVKTLEKGGFSGLVIQATQDAIAKSHELSQEK